MRGANENQASENESMKNEESESRDAYSSNRQVSGSPPIHAVLKEQGVQCGRKRVARLMRERSSSAKTRRRNMKTTESHHTNPVAANLLKRDCSADGATTKWVADIPGIETGEGWLSLAARVEISSRVVVGWAMGKERDEQLITNAAVMAHTLRRPAAGLIHHSDQGSQYTGLPAVVAPVWHPHQ